MRFEVRNKRMHEGRKQVPLRETPNKGGAFAPEGIVLHDTAGALNRHSSVNWLLNPQARASAHFVVELDGEVTQLAALDQCCWHCGPSRFGDRTNVNSFAFGIEIVNLGRLEQVADNVFKPWFKTPFHQGENGLEFIHSTTREHGSGYWQDYRPEQIQTVLELCRALRAAYPVKWITTHWFISPGRKIDTNPLFPLDELRAAVLGADPSEDPEVRTIANVNQRRWPSYHDNVIQVIPRGKAVEIIRSGHFSNGPAEVTELWHLVRHGEHEGWVHGDYLDTT